MRSASIAKKILLTIFAFLFIFSVINLNAEDEKTVKFPGKFNLEFKSQLDSDVVDASADKSVLADGELYFRNELKGKITFKPVEYYNIVPWIKDRFDLKFDFNDGASDKVKIQPRNRFYIGLNNVFKIPDVMDIGVNFEFRMANQVNKPLEVRLTPFLHLCGEYDFGLTWGIKPMFEFYLDPKSYIDPAENYLFKKFDLEIDNAEITFEFLHFFAPKEVKCSFVANMYLLASFEAGKKRQDDLDDDVTPGDKLSSLELYTGLNFDFWGITPYIGYYGNFAQYYNGNALYTQYRPGLKTGIGFKKDWFSLNIEYIGVILMSDTDPDEQEVLNERVDLYKYWENHISAYVKLKI